MGIEATSSSVSSAPTQTVSAQSSSSKTNSSDTSFKEEMTKVSESEAKNDSKSPDKDAKNIKSDDKISEKKDDILTSNKDNKQNLAEKINESNDLQTSIINAQYSINDANAMLSSDIAQMSENTVSTNNSNLNLWSLDFENGSKSSLKMNETDAEFFIDLTKTESVNIQSINAQAQNMLDNGAQFSEVKQNVQVSQALLDALSQARENNQPIRIDFDQNISVILRVGRDGAISAQFIPGDKAVEQYLRNNIDSLRNTFDEQELPYSELSYSTASKDQNQRRRQEKQQGE